jgi:hypothetical protein
MRRPKPWFRTSKNTWYVQHHGQKVLLGGHPEGAPPRQTKAGWNAPPAILDAFYKLMASDPANRARGADRNELSYLPLFKSYPGRTSDVSDRCGQ